MGAISLRHSGSRDVDALGHGAVQILHADAHPSSRRSRDA